jgi:hypothetical protein
MKDQTPIKTPTFNPWNYKPWWCQPWSILFTGITIISGSWFLFKTLWITILVAIPLLAWMGFFSINLAEVNGRRLFSGVFKQ